MECPVVRIEFTRPLRLRPQGRCRDRLFVQSEALELVHGSENAGVSKGWLNSRSDSNEVIAVGPDSASAGSHVPRRLRAPPGFGVDVGRSGIRSRHRDRSSRRWAGSRRPHDTRDG